VVFLHVSTDDSDFGGRVALFEFLTLDREITTDFWVRSVSAYAVLVLKDLKG